MPASSSFEKSHSQASLREIFGANGSGADTSAREGYVPCGHDCQALLSVFPESWDELLEVASVSAIDDSGLKVGPGFRAAMDWVMTSRDTPPRWPWSWRFAFWVSSWRSVST